jgi:hypothetical protein
MQVTKTHARWKAAGKRGRKPAWPSNPEPVHDLGLLVVSESCVALLPKKKCPLQSVFR